MTIKRSILTPWSF